MELEELKQNWQLLNERLEKNEILNKRIIKEMIMKRTSSIYSKLLNMEIWGLILGFIAVPTVLVFAQTVKNPPSLPWIISLEIGFVVIIIWEIRKIVWLKKFDLETKNIYQLSKIINVHRVWILKECIVSILIIFIGLAIRFITTHAYRYPWFALLLVSIVVLTFIYTIVVYQLIYKKYVNNLQKSLDELKEFEE